MEMYSTSPLARIFHPNKDELWLHWSLLDSSRGSAVDVLRRRLLPSNCRRASVSGLTATCEHSPAQPARYFSACCARLYHLGALPSIGWSALRWFSAGPG